MDAPMDAPLAPPVSRTDFRNAMARVCAPVTIVTTNGPAGRGGFTATAMCSVTDDPPSLLVCMNAGSAQCGTFLSNGRFCVNVLGREHQDLAHHFAGREPDMAARYAAAGWHEQPSGNAMLEGAIVAFDCTLTAQHKVGTHHVLIGRVEGLRQRADGEALLYFDRTFVNLPSPVGSFGG